MTLNPDPICPVHETILEFCDGSWFCESCWEEWDPEEKWGKEEKEWKQGWLSNIFIVKENNVRTDLSTPGI